MRLGVKYTLTLLVAIALWQSSHSTATTEDACRWEAPADDVASISKRVMGSGNRDAYTGVIRVYVTEITGRWTDDWGGPFGNAFLAFALEESIFLDETDTLTWELEWDGHDYLDEDGVPYGDLQEDNVKVIAAVFNSAGYPGYSDPPSGLEFTVYEVDACAGATCGTTGYNLVIDGFTHTVLAEDGTSTW